MSIIARSVRVVGVTLSALMICVLSAPQTVAAPAAARVSPDPNSGETKAHRDARMAWWRKARFGMFIHWGSYAVPAGVWKGKETSGAGEWLMHDLRIPVSEYAPLAAQFNPVRFNADEWVGIARAAGMKYIVMTAKHHEGFAMFHARTDGYNIYDASPFKRDPIAEMAAACKRQGIRFGVYYSQAQDWHHQGGAAYGGHWDPAQDGDLDNYVRTIAAPQVRQLLTEYHPAVLWWDTPVSMSPEDIALLTAAFHSDPGLIANNRLGNGVPGDTETPEQFIPATGYPGRDWETCMTMNDTWGYKVHDTDFKSEPSLLRNLIDIASKGGNYLLNVGPTAEGIIPEAESSRLEEMGQWLKKNGESIYGTSASPYRRLPFDGRVTLKGAALYLHVFTWPAAGLEIHGLRTPVRGARDLATGEKLAFQESGDGTVRIARPRSLDPVATVVALRLAGSPVVEDSELALAPDAGGTFVLLASDASLEGNTIRLEGSGDEANLGYWTNAKDAAHWKVTVPSPNAGPYHAEIDYASQPDSEGSAFEIDVDGAPSGVTGTITKTAGWGDYHTMLLDGTLVLPAGTHTLRIVPRTMPGGAVMNLRRITLIPAGK